MAVFEVLVLILIYLIKLESLQGLYVRLVRPYLGPTFLSSRFLTILVIILLSASSSCFSFVVPMR